MIEKPYPQIILSYGIPGEGGKTKRIRSELHFMSGKDDAQYVKNIEGDWVVLEQSELVDDLGEMIRHCDRAYLTMYATDGANVEIGLTGSKLQAVAIAALSAQRKFSQAWYVKPKEFDEKRFSDGFSELRLFELTAG